MKLPAYPLITIDPYISIWSNTEKLNKSDTKHWSSIKLPIKGYIKIDGTEYYFLGKGKNIIGQDDHKITPLFNEYTFQNNILKLKINFFTPLILNDADIFSRPTSYIDYDIELLTNEKHDIQLCFKFDESLTYNKKDSGTYGEVINNDLMNLAYVGKRRQPVLEASGDKLTINWGYMYIGSNKIDSKIELVDGTKRNDILVMINVDSNKKDFIIFGYDDIASMMYFGEYLEGYWKKKYKNIINMMEVSFKEHDSLKERCIEFDKDLLSRANRSGKKELEHICIASFRESICAHKLVEDKDGKLLFISKENGSNGCGGTVDVSYPSIPLYLIYNPELVLGMIRPILKFSRYDVWKYDFAPHDVGRYPLLNGNVYGLKKYSLFKQDENFPLLYLYSKVDDVYDFNMQMPVEESGNLLIMLATACELTNNKEILLENKDLIDQRVKYLIKYGLNPGNQLCTDDFAGHLASNANLAIKAILGIESYSRIMYFLSNEDEGKKYHDLAKEYADEWVKNATKEDGITSLTLDNKDGWSLKYNLVWDLYFNSHLFNESLYAKELNYYISKLNKYGVALDNRKEWTKADWEVYVSAFTNDIGLRRKIYKKMSYYLNHTRSKVPFSDWYYADSGIYNQFVARSVVGGCFIPILIDERRK